MFKIEINYGYVTMHAVNVIYKNGLMSRQFAKKNLKYGRNKYVSIFWNFLNFIKP